MRPLHVGLLLLIISAVAAWQVTLIPQTAMQMTVGATLVPAAVVAGLALVSVLYVLSALKGHEVDESQAPDQSAWPGAVQRMLYLLGGGVVFMVGVGVLGFLIPATLCGMGVARSFDAPLGVRSALICAAIATVFWVVFAQILGIGLGPALPGGR